MWQFETKKAENADYRLKVLDSLMVVLPGILSFGPTNVFNNSSFDYRIQCIRRKIEKFFSIPRCIVVTKKVGFDDFVDDESPWNELEPICSEIDLADIKLLFPRNQICVEVPTAATISVRCTNMTKILFVRRSATSYDDGSVAMYDVFHRPIPGSPAYNIIDCLSLTTLSPFQNKTKNVFDDHYQLKCLQPRHQSSSAALIVHDAFLVGHEVHSLLEQFALDARLINCDDTKNIKSEVVVVTVSCMGFLSDNHCEVSAEGVSRLTRCVGSLLSHLRQNISQNANVLLAVKDIQFCRSFSNLYESLSRYTSQFISLSVRVVYLVGDASLRRKSDPTATIGNTNGNNNDSNSVQDENEKKPFLSAATLLFKSNNDNNSCEDETDGGLARNLSEISLYLASSYVTNTISETNHDAPPNSISNYEEKEKNVRGLKQLMGIFERHICWPQLLQPLYGHLQGSNVLKLQPNLQRGSIPLQPEPVTGVLLTGGINSGKTRLSMCLSQLWQRRCIIPSPADIVSGLIGGTEENLKRHFQEAKRLQPSLLILEHFNSLLFSDNDDSNSSSNSSFLASLIACIDDLHRFNCTLHTTHTPETQRQHNGVLLLLLLRTDEACRAKVLDTVRVLQRPDRCAVQLDLNSLRSDQEIQDTSNVLMNDEILQMKRLRRQQWKN